MRHVFYLHGFASSPESTKAAFFAERLRPHGLGLHCPDFNEPDFEHVTVTRMLGQVDAGDGRAAARAGGAHRIEPGRVRGVPRGRQAGGRAGDGRGRRCGPSTGSSCSRRHSSSAARRSAGWTEDTRSRRGGETDRHEFFHHAENRPARRPLRHLRGRAALRQRGVRRRHAGARVPGAARHRGRSGRWCSGSAASRPAMTVRMAGRRSPARGRAWNCLWREIAAFLGLCE
ncbi:MAG: hypothetical protein MZW92_07495 [Comamonadaceae bacterium]|nr:hypothetical protein [Comamonadaceae bacterium]